MRAEHTGSVYLTPENYGPHGEVEAIDRCSRPQYRVGLGASANSHIAHARGSESVGDVLTSGRQHSCRNPPHAIQTNSSAIVRRGIPGGQPARVLRSR